MEPGRLSASSPRKCGPALLWFRPRTTSQRHRRTSLSFRRPGRTSDTGALSAERAHRASPHRSTGSRAAYCRLCPGSWAESPSVGDPAHAARGVVVDDVHPRAGGGPSRLLETAGKDLEVSHSRFDLSPAAVARFLPSSVAGPMELTRDARPLGAGLPVLRRHAEHRGRATGAASHAGAGTLTRGRFDEPGVASHNGAGPWSQLRNRSGHLYVANL
jgi:hypothetical protein